jgi:hypothetical protein
MRSLLRGVFALLLVAAFAPTGFAQDAKPLPEPLPMGVPYFYKPGDRYWFARAYPFPSPYPWGATVPIYGRYAWDYTGQFTGYPVYPYSYYYFYPVPVERMWGVPYGR